MVCSVTNYKDIVSVKYYTPEQVSFAKPFQVYDPVIRNGDTRFEIKADGQPAFEAAIDEMSAELSVEQIRSVGCYKYKCSLNYTLACSSSDRSYNHLVSELTNLQRNNYIVLVTYIGGDQHIIRSHKDGWAFSCKESGGDISISLVVENISGAQRVHTFNI